MIARWGYLTKLLSHLIGMLADVPVPPFARRFVITTFANAIKADLSEVANPIVSFKSCGDFFVRSLKPGSRPISSSPVIAPVDGVVRSITAAENLIPSIKGRDYSLENLLEHDSKPYQQGSISVFYLAPHNYHRVHAPFDLEVEHVKLIKGALWPVNGWGLRNIQGLFCVNERIVISGSSTMGKWALVMVGATNVGRMELTFCDVSALKGAPDGLRMKWKGSRGDELGRFRLGSTVVLITSFKLAPLEQQRAVRYGDAILLDRI